MMTLAIWERYFYRQFIGMFFLFLVCFYGLYILIDYATHASALAQNKIHIHWIEIVRYYVFVLANRAEILLPLALLIAFVHTICTLNVQRELVALMAGGYSLKLLMKPFLVMGFLCVFLMYANEQFLLPQALKKLRRIEDATKHQKHRQTDKITVKHVILEDKTLLIYQNYDTALERFFDVYWIESIDSIYRMKYLSPKGVSPKITNPNGYYVDHLVRQRGGELIREASYPDLEFPKMKFNPELLQSTLLEPDILSLTELAEEMVQISPHSNEKDSKILTAFLWKMCMPWLCLLAIIAPAPYSVMYSRQLPLFLIYVCSLFGLIAFYTFMDAAQVIAKRQVISPYAAICGPFIVAFALFGWRYSRMSASG